MIYLVYSQESEMARRSALKILKKDFPERSSSNYVSLNMAVSSIKDILAEVQSFSLIAERKAVFCENCAFLAKGEKATGRKAKVDPNIEALASYCLNPNPETDLYLVVYSKAIDTKNPIVDAISKTGQIKEVPVPSEQEWVAYALSYLKKKGASIDQVAASELVKRVGGDYGRFLTELAKLDAFSSGTPITLEDIKTLVSPRLEDDSFELSNALLAQDIGKCMKVYEDLKSHSIDEIRLINMLGKQFQFLDQVAYLSRNGYSSNDIATELSVNPYRVTISLRNLRNMHPKATYVVLEKLYRCEKSILTGEVDAEFAFTRFIAECRL